MREVVDWMCEGLGEGTCGRKTRLTECASSLGLWTTDSHPSMYKGGNQVRGVSKMASVVPTTDPHSFVRDQTSDVDLLAFVAFVEGPCSS